MGTWRGRWLRSGGWLLLAVACTPDPAPAQQKTGPGPMGDDSLTWHGITLYGVIDVGLQFDTHSAPFTSYRPAASGNIVRSNANAPAIGVTPSNMGQSRVGLQGIETLNAAWSAVFQAETFFNPQSGQIADSLHSLAANNGRPLTAQSVGVDGSSAGQIFQTAWAGFESARFGTLTFGRQVTLLADGTIEYDPNYSASAFGLLGASNTYSGGGSSEDNRLDSTAKYRVDLGGGMHLGALYKFGAPHGIAGSAWQADLGGRYEGASVDAYYSKVNDAITAATLTAAQVAALPALGYAPSHSLAATVSDDTTYALMASYEAKPAKFFVGYMYIQYANPSHPLGAGFSDIGGYVLSSVDDAAYGNPKLAQVYWGGLRYTVKPHLDLTAAYYGVHQHAYGNPGGCSTSAHGTCSGGLEAISFDADLRFDRHFDAYGGAMYSAVHDGLAAGYLHTTNVNPTIGLRYKF